MSDHGLVKFWSSILGETHIKDQLIPLMEIEDSEERTFKVLCQTLFLLVMELKHERKDTKGRGTSSKEDATCRSCQEKLSGNEELNSSEDSPKHEMQEKKILKEKKIANKNYRSLSRSSPSKKGLSLKKAHETVLKKDFLMEKDLSPEIIVPETLSFDENPLHVNVEKRKLHSGHTLIVPETLAFDCSIKEDDEYNNDDFFDTSNTAKENISPEECRNDEVDDVDVIVKSPSPVKNNSFELSGEQSPVLGKQSKVTVPRITNENMKLDVPKILTFEDTPKVLVEKSESVVSDKDSVKPDLQDASTPRYSPLVFTRTPLSLKDDTDMVSPSLLPGASHKNSQNNKIQDKSSPLLSMLNKKSTAQVQPSSRAKKSFQKSVSTFDASPPKLKGKKLQKFQTLNNQPKSAYEMTLDLSGPQNKKVYKQTKISADVFNQKGKIGAGKVGVEDEEGLRVAMMESLRSKEMEDMMRKKEKALQALDYGAALEEDAEESVPGPSSVQQSLSPTKVNQRSHRGNAKKTSSPIKLPKLSPTKSLSSPIKPFKSPKRPGGSPRKKLLKQAQVTSPSKIRSSPRKHISKSDRNHPKTLQHEKKSPRKRQPQTPEKCNQSPVKRRRVEETASHISKESRVLELDQLLKEVNESPCASQAQTSKAPEEPVDQKKMILRKNKKCFFDNSFDVVPEKNVEPKFAYRGEVVRKKDARKNLEGWGCRECEEWYENQDLNPEEKKRLMNKCSRHRSKHNPITNTPKNFWDPGWVDSEWS